MREYVKYNIKKTFQNNFAGLFSNELEEAKLLR